jgi:hypothetical protein
VSSRRETVIQAITFRGPERVPVVYWNRDKHEGDVMAYSLSLGGEGDEGGGGVFRWSLNEWGYRLRSRADGTIGYPAGAVYAALPRKGEIETPALREAERTAGVARFLEECGDRYRLATFDLSGFTVYTLLRGFESAMEDIVCEPEGFACLQDLVMDFECELIRMAARHGFDGVHFADDWGTQSGLMISPGMWRRVFQPRYRRQFAAAHDAGLHVWFHSCGNVTQICPDLHEAGVDVLNISQPNVVDLEEVSGRLRGRQCFMAPVSYQTVSVKGTPEEIFSEAARLWERLGTDRGGLIGYVEEYSCMGMPEENYRACGEAFRRLKRGKSSSMVGENTAAPPAAIEGPGA